MTAKERHGGVGVRVDQARHDQAISEVYDLIRRYIFGKVLLRANFDNTAVFDEKITIVIDIVGCVQACDDFALDQLSFHSVILNEKWFEIFILRSF